MRRWIVAATAAILLGGSFAGAPAARADDHVLADGLIGPLQIDVTPRGDVLVGQSFAGLLSRVDKHGGITDLVSEPGGVNGVANGPSGSVLYTFGSGDGSQIELKARDSSGGTRTIADLGAYEATNNPDATNTYGLVGIDDDCASQWPAEEFGPPVYDGIVESNPYALATTSGGTYVADAAGNAILFVDSQGGIRTAAVLPPQPLEITADAAAGLGLPDCVVGLDYHFEPVPTDVEMGRHGDLFVTTLPGGPEDPSLGARGSVYRIDPHDGSADRVSTGFLAATNLAIAPNGTIYVAELFANQISMATPSGPVPVAAVETPAGLEWAKGRLYVTSEVFSSGKIITVSP